MSENPITELYILGNDGETFIPIDPKTIAVAVEDETNEDSVQAFINNGITSWNQPHNDTNYVAPSLIREDLDNINRRIDEIKSNEDKEIRYLDEWDCSGQTDFSSIQLPVLKGSVFKIVGTTIINERIFKSGDFIFINREVRKPDVINDADVDIILGYGNEGTKISRYIADTVPTYADLEAYEQPVINSIIIVANDETHNNLLSFYEYIEGHYHPYDYEVATYADLLNIPTNLDVPNYQFSINELTNVISLNRYIGDSVNVNVPYIVYPQHYTYVKVNADETHDNETSYYKWENNTWNYIDLPDEGWSYMFSRKEIIDGVFRVKGSVATYNELPIENQQIGDVWNVLDSGANYCWTEEGWDKLSETIDLSDYYTKEEVDELISHAGGLPSQTGHSGEFLSTNGVNALWQNIPEEVFWANNVTFDEVTEAYNNDKVVLKNYSGIIYQLTSIGDKLENKPHTFSSSYGDISKIITLDKNDHWEYITKDLQEKLVSGTNIKTINGNDILGSGNIDIDGLPNQEGQSGKFLTTDGTNASWTTVSSGESLPSQEGHQGEVLYTNGEDAYWDKLPPAAIIRTW